MRDRHWAALADTVGYEIKKDEVTTLRRLLDNNIEDHTARVVELAEVAGRERRCCAWLPLLQFVTCGLLSRPITT